MTSIVENIKHYQKSIDRALNDESRLLHCIAKLYRLPVSVQHLQETGIGRTVNGLRKYDGEVGVAAKALVSKWKSMVAAEESEDGGGGEQQSGGNNHYDQQQDEDDEDDEDNYDESRLQVDEQPQEEEANEDSDQDMHENHESPRQEARREEYQQVEEEEEEEVESEEESAKVSKHKQEEHRKSSSSKSRDRHEKESTNHHSSSSSKSHSSSSSSKKSSSERDKKDKHKSSSERKSSSQQSGGKESSHSSSREKSGSSSSSNKHHSNMKVSSSKEDSNGYKKEESKKRRTEEQDDLNNSKKVKKEESSEKSNSKSSSRSSKSSSSSSSSSKDKSKKSSSSEKKRESSSKEKSPRSDHEEEAEEEEGLDSSAGASFADALAMIGMPSSSSSSKKKSSSDKPKKSSSSSMPPPAAKARSEKSSSRSSSSSSKSSRHKGSSSPQSTASSSGYSSSSSSSTVAATAPASLLDRNVALDPLPEASEIVEALPIISPHYKPMPLNQTVMGCVFGSTSGKPPRSHLTEEEALGHSMQSKNQRTKVYSGVKTYNGKVPSLFDSCIRMLQENIDLLDVTGGVPFDLLKPVLDRASPEQLMNLEHYNPYLMEDSDVLWEQHCRRQFRTQKRKEEECESWREMYMRCSEERDAKLRSLTQNIKMSQAEKVAPVRKTQLAYVDSAVKPPRSIISKQARYGTDRTPVVSPAARVAALKSASSNVAKAGDNRLRVAPGVRDTAQAVFQPMKPKKAPMMTKVMNSIKGIKGFRR
ncbi:transcription elongation factor B polypeptide 3 [Culex quinquefasciatus]|uniref:transcription elongation factor B polypeptide 3 n=1 Tax=Culex quinquefasciatus TaxID=7176 RepID=UPI0018E3942E|nr:transcription elongation factor B polypeptide 3 [Culex quinquefasciatus]